MPVELCNNKDIDLKALGVFGMIRTAADDDGKAIARLTNDSTGLKCAGRYSFGAKRTDTEIRSNNDVREALLVNLSKAFGYEVDKDRQGCFIFNKGLLAALKSRLGGVFKASDFAIDKNGRVSTGRPLTERRITAIVDKVASLHDECHLPETMTMSQRCHALATGLCAALHTEEFELNAKRADLRLYDGFANFTLTRNSAGKLRNLAEKLWKIDDEGAFLEWFHALAEAEAKLSTKLTKADLGLIHAARRSIKEFIALLANEIRVPVDSAIRGLIADCESESLSIANFVFQVRGAFASGHMIGTPKERDSLRNVAAAQS